MTTERHLLARLLAGDNDDVSAAALLPSAAAPPTWCGIGPFPRSSLPGVMRPDFGTYGGRALRLGAWTERCSSSADMTNRCATVRSRLPTTHGSSPSRFAFVRLASPKDVVAHSLPLDRDVLTGRQELVAALLSLLYEDE